mmetsp:Transcript_17402/g.43072  ORF Transcript_17402/g.43072 Transcript_17402/m.43072 type:complete len:314 (-) Transcript_17402:912-1853(-)
MRSMPPARHSPPLLVCTQAPTASSQSVRQAAISHPPLVCSCASQPAASLHSPPEVEATLGNHRRRLERKLVGVGVHCRREVLVLLVLQPEILLQDLHGLIVDVVVVVVLQILDLLQSLRLVDELRILVGRPLHLVHFTHLEDVLQSLQRHRHDARVAADDEVAQRLDATLVHEVFKLLVRASAGGVGDGPRRLLFDVELGVGQQVDEGRDDVVLHDGLDLVLVPGSDVRDGPARLLLDALLVLCREQRQQRRQRAAVDDDLGLVVVTGYDVAHRAQRRDEHGRVLGAQQLHQPPAHAGLDDRLDLVVGAVGQV